MKTFQISNLNNYCSNWEICCEISITLPTVFTQKKVKFCTRENIFVNLI